jgi:hypothetical protein
MLKWKVPDSSGWDTMTDQQKKEDAAAQISGLEVEDIDAGNSRIVMDGEDGNYDFAANGTDPSGIPYDEMRAREGSHAGIVVDTTRFDVTVTNETATSGSSGDTNSGVSAPETTDTSNN